MKFSVLLPVHDKINDLDFKKSIKSILSNSLKPTEIIIIVDGKIDLTKKSFLKFLSKKHKIFKVYYKKKIGLTKALNFGLNICENELIFRADADDFNKHNRFKIQLNYMKKYKLDVLGSQISEKYKSKKIIKRIIIKPNFVNYILRNPINHMTVLYKKSKILKIGGYPDIPYKEDYALWLKCYFSGLKIKNIKRPLVDCEIDESFFQRRSNIKSILSEISLFIYSFKINPALLIMLIPILLRCIILIMPRQFFKLFFLKILRK